MFVRGSFRCIVLEMSNGLDFYWAQSSPSVQSIWTGLDSKFWPAFWAWTGWTNFWLGWTDWTFIWSHDDGLDWTGPNFLNGPGLSAYSRTTKMSAKRSNVPYFKPNVLRFVHLHQFYPFQVSSNVRNYGFMAKIATKQIFSKWAGLSSGLDWVGQICSGNFMDLDWMDLNFRGLHGLDLFE